MKKKILFVSDSLRTGGIQKSLIDLLNKFNYEKYDVFLFLFNDNNIDLVNKNVKIIKSNTIFRIIGMTSKEARTKGIFIYFIRLVLSILCKIFSSQVIYSIIYLFINFEDKYDLVISYSNNVNNRSLYYGYNKLVLDKIKANSKISWVHIDYINKQEKKWELKEFNKFNKIVLVSNNCKINFDKVYPSLKDKTVVVYNYLDKNSILKKSIEFIPNIDKENSILSIGRLEKNKNFEMQLRIAKKLTQSKLNFKWYIIGEGNNKDKLLELSKLYGIEDNVVFLGSKNNVYPYIKNSKILISTSLSESFGLTIAEAQILNTPVIALNYPSLNEIIDDNGIICNSELEMYNNILNLFNNEKEYSLLKEKTVYKIKDDIIDKQLESILKGI